LRGEEGRGGEEEKGGGGEKEKRRGRHRHVKTLLDL
jgi:hypothetical protein